MENDWSKRGILGGTLDMRIVPAGGTREYVNGMRDGNMRYPFLNAARQESILYYGKHRAGRVQALEPMTSKWTLSVVSISLMISKYKKSNNIL